MMRVGERAPSRAFDEDWVLVHEMIHLAFPSMPREQNWVEEGLATYVEPFARVRTGILGEAEAWRGLVAGLPNGLPVAGDRGLDHTPTWGRTYWGGALFFLLADIEIRERSQGRFGLDDALRAIVAAGGNNAVRWSLADSFAIGDAATGLDVLTALHAKMGAAPYAVDLPALFESLGVRAVKGVGRGPSRDSFDVVFDEQAPRAALRRAMAGRKE
jgi:hypothetical protein